MDFPDGICFESGRKRSLEFLLWISLSFFIVPLTCWADLGAFFGFNLMFFLFFSEPPTISTQIMLYVCCRFALSTFKLFFLCSLRSGCSDDFTFARCFFS